MARCLDTCMTSAHLCCSGLLCGASLLISARLNRLLLSSLTQSLTRVSLQRSNSRPDSCRGRADASTCLCNALGVEVQLVQHARMVLAQSAPNHTWPWPPGLTSRGVGGGVGGAGGAKTSSM